MTEQHWFVDRLEGEIAVICGDDGRCWNLPRWMLPAEAGEGTHLRVSIQADPEATEIARAEVRVVQARLRARDRGGDLML